ncbi:hypothetical protein PIB30_018058 [Stylosanthes scabra]|uniref:Uncharacterized protein n=1 Tax=Stylosanthes scabra TaxID=79078 RepID=A0ABU6X636_9FABA|nr:hypothetical protein [Stylosanthes scabra]
MLCVTGGSALKDDDERRRFRTTAALERDRLGVFVSFTVLSLSGMFPDPWFVEMTSSTTKIGADAAP